MENLEDLLGTNRITTDTGNEIKRSYLTEKAFQNEIEKPKKLLNKPDTFDLKKNTSLTTNKKPRSAAKKDEESQQFKIPSVPKKLLSYTMDARREKAMRKYKEYTSAFGDNKLKGKNISKLTNQCSTEDFEAENLHIEDTLSDADRLLMMKMGYKAFNQFIEDKHQYLPFINQMDLRGLGSNSEKTWMNVKDTFQELVIKYDIGRTPVILRTVAAIAETIRMTNEVNSRERSQKRKETDEEIKSQIQLNEEKLKDILNKKK
ncbi:hypothetical protein ACTFIY_011133 [Dictyostelium cf. discoideum]